MTREEATEFLTDLYGPDPSAVGEVDGTEDDFGDLVTADLPHAVLGRTLDDGEFEAHVDALMDALGACSTWGAALDAAERLLLP